VIDIFFAVDRCQMRWVFIEIRSAYSKLLSIRVEVALKPDMSLSENELIAHCRRSLANYKVPRRVELSDTELPKSGSGKILKRILRERFWVNQESAVS
jgi:acyl-CoA synthetase (AMP-forming)/AMP-acid ligase II